MKAKYDYIFITNIPAFYKINLYNELAKKLKIKVIYISNKSSIRNSDFVKGGMLFDHEFLWDGEYEKRNKIVTIYRVLKSLSACEFKKIVYPGWELLELIIPMVFLNKAKNSMVIESSISESRVSGPVWWMKKMLINRMGTVFPSGKLQRDIVDKANFKGNVYLTHGVGIPKRESQRTLSVKKKKERDYKYLYVGRYSEEKNLEFLIKLFNENNRVLTLIGSGPLHNKLSEMAFGNVTVKGYVPNDELYAEYQSHDCFILPSLSEPWGLVVDEALWNGIPIIASNNVGCLDDLVKKLNTGVSFDPNCSESFNYALLEMENNYPNYAKNSVDVNFSDRDFLQCKAYELGLYGED